MTDLLSVRNLNVEFQTRKGRVEVLRDIRFDLRAGESLGLVGESGSGKSVTSLSLMGLLPDTALVRSGEISFQGKNLLRATAKELEKIRGVKIAMIFQDPMTSLNPCYSVEEQIGEVLKIHEGKSGAAARDRVLELLNMVGIPDPQQRLGSYPHELSGGMSQRVMIAMAMACRPQLLIADEPTTALDVTIQAQILRLLGELRRQHQMSMILVSHDLGVIGQNTDRICVMYAGEVVEQGTSEEVLKFPRHPYTRALLESLPAVHLDAGPGFRLPQIPGQVMSLNNRVRGCQFQDRCKFVKDICRGGPIAMKSYGSQQARCVLP